MGASLAIAGVALTPFAALSPPQAMPDADVLASLAVLGIACTRWRSWCCAALVSEIGPGRALVITYVNPVVAVALGVVVLGEHVGPGSVAGLLLIIAGSWLSTDGRLPPGLVRRDPAPKRRRAAAQSPLSPAIRRSKPAGAWMLNIRTGVLPWLVKACGHARRDEHERAGRRGDLLAVAELEGHLALRGCRTRRPRRRGRGSRGAGRRRSR